MKLLKIIIIIFSIIILFLGWYYFRLTNADLLTDWKSSGGFIGKGSSKYYLINSKTGSKTYLPAFLLSFFKYDAEKTDQENKIWEEKIQKLNPEFYLHTYVSGQFDENIIIFTILKQGINEDGFDMYSYDIKNNQYTFLMHDDKLTRCVAGNGKIFYRLSIVGSGRASELTDAIYQFDINTGEKLKIGEYHTKALNLDLEKVLK